MRPYIHYGWPRVCRWLLMLSLWAVAFHSLGSAQVERAKIVKGFDLTLEVDGVRSGKGVVGVLVFRSAKGWPEDTSRAFRSVDVPARKSSTVVSVTNLPPGTYAVVVLHDENANMKLDRDWMGVPKEQWGMSRNPHAQFAAPEFDRAEFELARNLQMRIVLQ